MKLELYMMELIQLDLIEVFFQEETKYIHN